MPILPPTPPWFIGFDVTLEIIFAITAMILALYALRLYKITSQRSAKLFGSGFLLISISYFIQAALNFLVLGELNEPSPLFTKVNEILTYQYMGLYLHIFLMLSGLMVLLYMSFNIKNKKALAALLLIILLPLLFDVYITYTFYLTSTIAYAFIAWYYIENYQKNPKRLSLLTAIAFIVMMIGSALFFFSTNQPIFYAIGHILHFAAYILILINFYLVLRK
ncbi:MAG: hypothetical protein WCI04_04185 [archaeon]